MKILLKKGINMMMKARKVHRQAEKAMREAVEKVVAEHKKSGVPLAVWKNGKVVNISAKRIRFN